MTYSVKHLQTAINERSTNHIGEQRALGIEIELSDIKPVVIAKSIQELFGGKIKWLTPFEIEIENTEFGCFKVELDSRQIKDAGKKSNLNGSLAKQKILESENSLEISYLKALSKVASSVVPWEIVTPPIALADIPHIFVLVHRLQQLGAKGTRDAFYYSFGVHLNPEATDLMPRTIVNHLRSFFCLYEWITDIEQPDLARRITPHINHFPKDYILKVLDLNYSPNIDELINDYIDHNPTRNRDLDMLPMFAFLKPKIIRERINDERVNARPTFHYRLPNCDIDNPEWNIDLATELWMLVEELAIDPKLASVCAEYRTRLSGQNQPLSSSWEDRISELLPLFELKVAS